MSRTKSLLAMVFTSFVATVRLAADCSPTVVVQVPPAACKSGMATAAVGDVPGATYAWTVEGGEIAGDAASDRISIALGTNATATASVTLTAGGCVSHGSGVIALHDPFIVRPMVPEAHASEPVTILWTYENGSPARQTITGSDFGLVTLPPDARSYTYTPETSGSRQMVIDATMETPTSFPPATSRRRSVSKSPATASTCASVHTTAMYMVGECVAPPVVIEGPDTVLTGSTFQLKVVPQAGADATWTITNGSPARATGNSVMITAGANGSVVVSVRLARGACESRLDRSITITAALVCNHPTAVVSAGAISCGSARVNAVFTGTPPFQGVWSDHVPFTSDTPTLVRTVTAPGNYSILNFEDAACAGTSSGVAALPVLGPTATIVGKANSCVDLDSVTVQFTGTPPFSGLWTDDSSFVTNDMQIVKPITATGSNTLVYGYDGTDCRLIILGGVEGRPTQKIHAARFCLPPEFDNVVSVSAHFNGSFTAPLTVTWSDGITMSSNGTPVYRVANKPQQTTTYTIASAHDAYCSAIFGTPSVTVYASPIPDFTLGVGNLCTGQTATASLATPPPPDAQVNWFLDNGSVVSGQGTSTIQYKTGSIGTTIVGCTFTFADSERCPTSTRRALGIEGDPKPTLSLPVAEIHAGETADITFTVDYAVRFWHLDNSLGDAITLFACNHNELCHARYTSTHGAGQSTITLYTEGFCSNTKNVSALLTILP